ncbi:MAG TPA: hypothetical protein VJ650_10910 [Gemmatimonadaceae bacterium]|nr:hypothetical protein [Gemmatimonadaceae bacterium]
MSVASRPWEWEDVRATTDDEGTHLAHVVEPAQLMLRKGRLVKGAGYETASPAARRSLARVGAILRLRTRGRYLVHAAAVVDPQGGAWLLAGDSGSGKSTLAWVLVRQGWSLLGDDGVLIEDTDRGVVARAWRDPLRVSLGLAHRFPELQALAPRVAARDARTRVPVERDVVREAPVRTILFLERGQRDRVLRVGPAVTLASLVRQSPWVLIDDADAPRHLTVLAAAAESVPAYHFAHSERQLEELPRTLASLG